MQPRTTPSPGDDQPALASTALVTASALVLIVVPAYHLMDMLGRGAPTDLLWTRAFWRLPPFLVAVAAMVAFVMSRHQALHQVLLRVLTLSVMVMMFGLFSADLVHESGNSMLMARGIIICTFAVSLLSLNGARELLLICGLPFLGTVVWLASGSVDLRPVASPLIDSVTALFIASIISEVFFRNRRYQSKLQDRLQVLARTDALTRLPNRRVFEDRFSREMARNRRHGHPLSVAIGDLDHFKRVNDEFGHAVGDAVLRAVAERIGSNLRIEDLAVRWGGEEFLLLLPDTTVQDAFRVAEKIRAAVAAAPVRCGGGEVAVTMSFGVAQLAGDEGGSELVRRADDAMYRAKSSGRDCVCE